MDNLSFASPGGVKSPYSPKVRQSVTSKNSSLLTSLRNQTKLNVSGRINQAAQIILKTSQNTVESYGLPLPVLVTETLTFADSNAHISARLSPGGWGWVVCGRRLLVWRYRGPMSTALVTCYELTLPQTDLAHRAELVCVFTADGNQIPSCIGVSPEGVVRYWPSVSHEGGYTEEAAVLHGQECDSLIDATPVGCVLATTTCTIVLVQANVTGGRHGVTTRTLRGSGGWLGGISRRVSSLFFSAMPSSQSVETKLVGVAALEPSGEDGPRVCMVAGLCAQLWQLGSPERLAFETDMQRTLRDGFLQAHMFPPGDPGQLDIHILDLHPWNDGLLLLTAAVNTVRSPQMRYALAHVCTSEDSGGQLLGLVPLQTGVNGPENGAASGSLGLRLLASSSSAYLYDKNRISVASCLNPNEKADLIDFTANGDQILGGGMCFGVPLFFSKMHGVISILSNENAMNDLSVNDSPAASPRPSEAFDGHLSLYELDPLEVASGGISGKSRGSAAALLKAAFLHHMRREHTASRSILADLFPPGDDITGVDTSLDRTVLAIATDLLDDVPTSDPRWGSSGSGLGSSGSLQILLQLQDKRRAMSLLLDFIRASGLWRRLGGASRDGGTQPAPTAFLLRGLAERAAAAIALRTLQQQQNHQHAVDTVIQQVMAETEDDEDSSVGAGLSPSDLFYKRVSRVERSLIRCACWCAEQEASGCAPPALTQLITKVNKVLIAVLQEVLKYRQQNASTFIPPPESLNLRLDPATWTSCTRTGRLQGALQDQCSLSISRARKAAPGSRSELRAQAAALASVTLQFAVERTEADCRGKENIMKEYAQMRTEMIQPFIDDEEYDHAFSLAEKFHDFEMLVLVCEKSNNRDRLYHYMDKFEDLGFQECAFNWFMERGRGGQAALLKAFPRHAAALSRWLGSRGTPFPEEQIQGLSPQPHSQTTTGSMMITEMQGDGSELLWLHELRADRWREAADTLLQLATVEAESVARMTVQASLSKLCALAAEGETGTVEEILKGTRNRLLLAEHHSLPPALLASHGLDVDDLRVMEPREIIDMFITSTGIGLSEYDYSRALELCSLVALTNDDPDDGIAIANELRRRVWCATILCDAAENMLNFDTDSPLDSAQEMMFFKVVNAVHLLDCNLDEYLVRLDDLLNSSELAEVSKDKKFQYIMKVGYEHVYRSQADMAVD